MKTKISRMLALTVWAFVVIIISSSGKSKAAERTETSPDLKNTKRISKIIVAGNVNVFLTQGIKEDIQFDNQKHATLRYKNDVLYISSFGKQRISVSLTVTNLSAIVAGGNVIVRTMNELSSIDLDIQLKDNASAQIEAQAVNITSSLTGASKLELAGESENQHLNLSGESQFQANRFFTQNRSMTVTDGAVATINQQGQSTSVHALTSIPVKETESSFRLSY